MTEKDIEAERYLRDNPDLLPVIEKGKQIARQVLGSFDLELDVHTDPEEGWDELFLIFRVEGRTVEETVQLEEQLFDAWFVKYMDQVAGRLNFSVEDVF